MEHIVKIRESILRLRLLVKLMMTMVMLKVGSLLPEGRGEVASGIDSNKQTLGVKPTVNVLTAQSLARDHPVFIGHSFSTIVSRYLPA